MKTDLSIKAAIYLRAAELVEQGGLCKEALWKGSAGETDIGFSDAKSFCYHGAIIAASYEMLGYENEVGLDMSDWNDSPDTTAAMVAAKLREQAFA